MQKTIEAAAAKFVGDIVQLVRANVLAQMESAFMPKATTHIVFNRPVVEASDWYAQASTTAPNPTAVKVLTGNMAPQKPKTILPPKPRTKGKPLTATQRTDAEHAATVLSRVRVAGKDGIKTGAVSGGLPFTASWTKTLLGRLLKAGKVKRIGRTRGTRWVAVGVK